MSAIVRDRFDTILQYPLCVDYIYVLPWMVQRTDAYDNFHVSREEFCEYLKSYQRSDPATFIPPLEIPDEISFRTVQYQSRGFSFDANLKWKNRPTGPGFIRMIGEMSLPSTGKLYAPEKILDFRSIDFVWYSPDSVIRRVSLGKIHVHHYEEHYNVEKCTLVESWIDTTGKGSIDIISTDLDHFAVHEDVFPDEMSRFLFTEEVNGS